jgi:outer membrane protein TolC
MPTPTAPRPTPRRTSTACLAARAGSALAIASILLTTSGCNSPSVDDRVDALIAQSEKDAGVGLDSRLRDATRERARRNPLTGGTPALNADAESRGVTQRTPATTNPDAAELQYSPAAEARDVRATLESYGTRYGETAPENAAAENAVELGIEDALRQAQRTSTEFLRAQEDYILAAISLLQERHLWGPRLFNDTSLALAGEGDNGDFSHALDVINTLRVNQRLPSGGSVEARWIWNATEQLRQTAGGRYRQSSELVLSGEVPLLRGAGDIAQESRIQAERDLVYAAREFERTRREFLVAIATDYFDLLEARARIANQIRQIESLRRFELATAARVRAGTLQPFETAIASSRLLAGEANLESLRESYTLALERFRIRLGLRPDARVVIREDIPIIPEPAIDPDEAALRALELRLDLQNQRDRVDDARRAVANARNGILPDLDITGQVGIPTDPDEREGGVNFSGDDLNYRGAFTLSLPLDRERERLAIRQSVIRAERAEREYGRARDEVIVESRSAVRAVELARFRLTLAERQVEINKRRLESQILRAAEVDAQTIIDTENALLESENDRDSSITALRTAVLNYLLTSDQLRVARDGTLMPLPGMDLQQPK